MNALLKKVPARIQHSYAATIITIYTSLLALEQPPKQGKAVNINSVHDKHIVWENTQQPLFIMFTKFLLDYLELAFVSPNWAKLNQYQIGGAHPSPSINGESKIILALP